MGCDIHLFAEFGSGESSFNALSDGQFLLRRDYGLFAALAGVRATKDFVPLERPRGLPLDVSQHVADRYFLPVLDVETASSWAAGEYCTPAEACTLVDSGRSQWIPSGMTIPLFPSTHGYVSNPDWHSASWLAVHEVHRALEHAHHPLESCFDDFQLLLVYLNAVVERKRSSTRVVVWFDN